MKKRMCAVGVACLLALSACSAAEQSTSSEVSSTPISISESSASPQQSHAESASNSVVPNHNGASSQPEISLTSSVPEPQKDLHPSQNSVSIVPDFSEKQPQYSRLRHIRYLKGKAK